MSRFNLRVYGILINERKHVLVADEMIHGQFITKFPGGGLEFGEGTLDCLRREFKEETGVEIAEAEHFYTTDFFQRSAFKPDSQVLSIYYLVKPVNAKHAEKILCLEKETHGNGVVAFRWMRVESLNENDFTFPIDRKVAAMIKKSFSKFTR
jgi:ADP-ribose pyrophosphatase YjhB (NUDIX family)